MHASHAHAPLPPQDAQALQAMPDCEQVDLLLPDANGLLRGKRIAREALEKVYADGVCLPMSLLGTDITGNTVEETGLGYDIGDQDRCCRPVPGTLRCVPWASRPTAQLLLHMEDGAGASFAANPRAVLADALARLRARGLNPVLAVELEFYLFDRLPDAAGRPQTAIDPMTGARHHDTQVYSMSDLDDQRGFIDAVVETCRVQRIPADTAVAEYAPGQYEINLRHRDDALAACDDAIMLKRAIKAVAQRQGRIASFMAKPLAAQAGSGLHLHVSLLDAQGRNVLAGAPDRPTDALLHAIGGLQQTARDCLLMLAPHANSYRRFVANAFVPLDRSWGFNNRTVAMRIPHSDLANTRIEHRVAGADANVYLAAAAVLAGMLHGLEHRCDPGPPVTGNAYTQAAQPPLFWRDAVEDFIASHFVAERFGTTFQHVYGQLKRKELRDFHAHVSPLELDWYLRTV